MGGPELSRVEALRRLAGHDDESLLACWPALKPIEKAACFKLLPQGRALAFFAKLSFEEQYFLLGSLPAGTLAPLLEDASPQTRALFRDFAPADVDALLAVAGQEAPCSK